MINSISHSPMRKLELRADKLWSQVIYAVFEGHCAKCGSTYGVTPHHVIKRRNKSVRHEIYNGLLHCPLCHSWAENHPEEYLEWMKGKFPKHHAWNADNRNRPVKVRYGHALLKKIDELKNMKRQLEEL